MDGAVVVFTSDQPILQREERRCDTGSDLVAQGHVQQRADHIQLLVFEISPNTLKWSEVPVYAKAQGFVQLPYRRKNSLRWSWSGQHRP